VNECGSDEERDSDGACVKKTPIVITRRKTPTAATTGALSTTTQDKPDLVELGELYHSPYTEESIFTPNRTGAKKGGMIQKSNAVDDIVRLLRGK
jgi:hypothetical protein